MTEPNTTSTQRPGFGTRNSELGIRHLLSRFDDRRVLVIGDLMLDEYVWGQVNRISPEAPVMVVEVSNTTWCLGGAGNVAHNVQAMGGHAIACGLVGDDPNSVVLRNQLLGIGCDDSGLVAASERPTTVKTRIVAHSQQVVRVDREVRKPVNGNSLKRMSEFVRETLPTVDAVILSDYAKGALADSLVSETVLLARQYGKPLCANLKPPRVEPFRGAIFLTLNVHEAERAANETIANEADLLRVGAVLRGRLECDGLLVTRGPHGVALFTASAEPLLLPARPVEVYDVAGAGDAVIAAAAMALASAATLAEAAAVGNLAGNAKVTKLGVAPVSREDILRIAGNA